MKSATHQGLNFPPTATLMRCGDTVPHAQVSKFVCRLKAEAPWHEPIYKALLVGDIAVVIPLPGQALPMARIKTIGVPTIVHICDDGPFWLGPDGWSCASYACDWAKAIMVNGTGGQSGWYASAVEKAREVGRVTIVDCDSDHFEAWRRCAAAQGLSKPIVGFMPPPGQVHPVDREP
jgi:hypothetical protein